MVSKLGKWKYIQHLSEYGPEQSVEGKMFWIDKNKLQNGVKIQNCVVPRTQKRKNCTL